MALPLLTIFSTCKPFEGVIVRVQRNAIQSWLALEPRPEIILFGRDAGVAECCKEFGITHVPDVRTAPSGAPYLDDLFRRAAEVASGDVLCYVNADIILLQDFLTAAERVWSRLGPCALVATPWNVRIDDALDFSRDGWQDALRTACHRATSQPSPYGADVFLFPRSLRVTWPPLIIGRLEWDFALMYTLSRSPLPAVDITYHAQAIHQDHSDSTHSGHVSASRHAAEVGYNRSAISRIQRWFWRVDLPWVLQADGTLKRRPLPYATFLFRFIRRRVSHAKLQFLTRTFRLRRRLGLYRWWLHA